MKERPILFSGPMVRAIREGRKTQTRRIIKPQPSETHWDIIPGYKLLVNGPHNLSCGRLGWRFQHCIPQNPVGDKPTWAVCPFGQPGDRLWVKETWRTTNSLNHVKPSNIRPGAQIEYKAGGHNVNGFQGHPLTGMGKWRQSIFMSKWMSRVILEIVSVRVERLKDISNDDCWKEGMCDATNPELKANRRWFSELWESINKPGSWDQNPWVWVIEFKEVKP